MLTAVAEALGQTDQPCSEAYLLQGEALVELAKAEADAQRQKNLMGRAIESLRCAHELSLHGPTKLGPTETKKELRRALKIEFLMQHTVEVDETKAVLADTKKKLSALQKLYVIMKIPKPQQAADKRLYPQLAKVIEAES